MDRWHCKNFVGFKNDLYFSSGHYYCGNKQFSVVFIADGGASFGRRGAEWGGKYGIEIGHQEALHKHNFPKWEAGKSGAPDSPLTLSSILD